MQKPENLPIRCKNGHLLYEGSFSVKKNRGKNGEVRYTRRCKRCNCEANCRRRDKLRKQKLCYMCGRRPPIKGAKGKEATCRECHLRNAKRMMKKRRAEVHG